MDDLLIQFSNPSVVDWILAGITLAAVLVAIFQEHIRRIFWKPEIVLEVNQKPPDCQKLEIHRKNNLGLIQASALSYYFRLRVKNNGSVSAESVELQASKLSKHNGETYDVISSFTPMNLVFSHTHERYLESLSPNMEKLCDIFHIVDPSQNKSFIPRENESAVIWFDLEVTPSNYGNLIFDPGLYKLDIVVGASNIRKPIKRSIKIDFSGNWSDDENEMIGKEIKLWLID
jgi:hypothetical protein